MVEINIGDTVKMSDSLKKSLTDNNCQEHVEEFGDCIGIVESWEYPNEEDINIVNVRWKPSELRYAYSTDLLILNDV